MSSINGGVLSDGSLDYFAIVKWMLCNLVIFILVQNYWELQTGRIYIFSYHRFKSKKVWILTNTAKVFVLCVTYSVIIMGLNFWLTNCEPLDIIRQMGLYALFLFNVNYFFCMLKADSKVKMGIWVALFGITTVMSSLSINRQIYNINSYGMYLQQRDMNDYWISIIVNVVLVCILIAIYLILNKRRRIK